MTAPFLTARWQRLLNLTYAVDPTLLEPHVPSGVTLDVQDGRAFASLVAFDFLDTKVFGIPWPGFRNFPELNLRFYVKDGEERGVVFIREYVPQRWVAFLARAFYSEPYAAAPMTSRFEEAEDEVRYRLELELAGRRHAFEARAGAEVFTPASDSTEHYFKEHNWGWGTDRRGRTLKYRVEHPVWEVWPLREWSADADFGALYGPEWGFLAEAEPFSALLAVGSAVKVFPGETVG